MDTIEHLAAVADANRDRPFYFDAPSGRQYTHGAFHALARAFGRRLRAAGAEPGDRIGAALPNGPELAALYLGCLYEGLVAVPVQPVQGPADIRYILDLVGAAVVVHTPETTGLLPPPGDGPSRRLCVHPHGPAGGTQPDSSGWVAADDGGPSGGARPRAGNPFVITFTSGTTSRPKGVCHTVGSLLGAAAAFNAAHGIGPDHRFLHVLNMGYMAGLLNTLLCPLLAGGSVVVGEPFGPQTALRFWDHPRRFGVNTLWLVPTICAALLRLDRDPDGPAFARANVRLACVGTAPLGGALRTEFERKYGIPLLESYGLSEVLFVAANRPDGVRQPGSVGPPLDGVRVRAVDDGENVIDGEGELEVATPFAMAGYLDPSTGRPTPPPLWFRTGDLGTIDPDGNLFITGRKKDLIIRGGINVSPRAVEEALCEHPAVADAAVVGVPHEFYGEEVVAFVQLRAGAWPDLQAGLAAHCRPRLSPAAVPSRFVVAAELPRNSVGKVLKGDLKARLARQEGTG